MSDSNYCFLLVRNSVKSVRKRLRKHEARKKEEACIEELPCECVNCTEGCEEGHTCACCQEALCDTCGVPNDCIHKEQWLSNISNECNKCKRIVCGGCMQVCYECANNCEVCESSLVCQKCIPKSLSNCDCGYHNWSYCEKYKNPPACGECHANRNYCLKMQ